MDYGKEQKFDLDQYNLDTDEWDSSTKPQHSSNTLGNKAISASESARSISETNTSNLGQIIPTMPPGYTEPEATGLTESTKTKDTKSTSSHHISFKRNHVMSGENLSQKAVNFLQDRGKKMNDDNDAAAYLDDIDSIKAEFQGQEAA